MRRKLLAINLALVALAAGGFWKLRLDYRQAQERYKTIDTGKGASGGVARSSPATEPAGLAAVQPASYLEAAEKYLPSPDRNPTVIVAGPKPKPRPGLPILFGVMSIGDSPIAIMADKQGAPHKTVKVGEPIGEYKLLGVAGDQITLQWEGQTIQTQVSDVLVKPTAETAQAVGRPATIPPTSARDNPPPPRPVRPR